VTQFARQAHWLSKRPNATYSPAFKWIMRWVPFAIRVYRAWLYYRKERDFAGFHVTNGLKTRDSWKKETVEYIRKTAPDRYLDFLIPKTEIGCKRRVNDTDYLACLHRDNVELLYNDPIQGIESKGVRTKSGKLVAADAIVLAHGFETQTPLFPMKIYGKDGISINEHVSTLPGRPGEILTMIVGSSQWRSSLFLLRNLPIWLSQLFRHDGSQHAQRPSLSDIHHGMPI
jgi:cation diffusion facilitator CzcD-associated flavoprotein CzcO